MKQLHGKLPEAFAPVFPMLKFSRIPLGKFHFDGTDGNHAYWFIDQLFYGAEDWASKVDRVLSADLQLPLDPREWDYLSKIDDNLPLGEGREEAIRDRLDLEESQLLRDLPKYAEIIGLKEKNPETVFEIAQEVDRFYDLAFSMVSLLRQSEAFTEQTVGSAAITFFEGDDEEQAIAQAINEKKAEIEDQRWELIDLRSQIERDLEELREVFLGVTIKVFEFSYAELGDFDVTGDRGAYASLTTLAYSVRKWIGETIGYLGALDSFVDLRRDRGASRSRISFKQYNPPRIERVNRWQVFESSRRAIAGNFA